MYAISMLYSISSITSHFERKHFFIQLVIPTKMVHKNGLMYGPVVTLENDRDRVAVLSNVNMMV
jgi:hypothetical protein